MEQNFQTSFIPKKPLVKERAIASRPVGLILVIAIFVLFTVLITSGGLYFYKELQGKRIENMKRDLALAQNRFEPAKISELQVLDKRLKASTEILENHVAVTPIFQTLGDMTLKTVRFTHFSYALGTDDDPRIKVTMSGQAVGYRSIALQSDLFAENKNFIDPVFSNLNLDTKGNVLFDLEFSVDPSFIEYEHTLAAGNQPT